MNYLDQVNSELQKRKEPIVKESLREHYQVQLHEDMKYTVTECVDYVIKIRHPRKVNNAKFQE